MKILLEKEAEALLAKNKFKIVPTKFVSKKSQVKALEEKINFPWAVKVYSKKIVHKTKAGGVVLDINSIEDAEKAFDKLSKLPGFEGCVIQEMMKKKSDFTILGLKATPEFGLVIMVGAGGSDVEKLKDMSFRVLPISKEDAKEMINELKIKTRNQAALEKNLLELCKFAEKYPKIKELDINPFAITKEGGIVVDARIII